MTARLAAARWCCLGAQARLNRLDALNKGRTNEAAACLAWAEVCALRRAFWDGEALSS